MVFRSAHAASALSDSRTRQKGPGAARHPLGLWRRGPASILLRGGGTGVPLVVFPREAMVCQGLLLRGTSLGSLCLSYENRRTPDRSAPWSSLGRRGGIRCGATCFREFTARIPKPPTCRRCTSLASDPTDPSQTPDPRI